ncbi:hypothetical protein SAMN05192566_1602 [Methylophilus rhizosphaerae]|uniref:Uncharacterized protein n=1 Tax=Methylophilus rhizosphaerae TaxID=492660 RepID=A0A1G9CSG8_9PROT|nr:hypothetical protein [Methylophilus rhizosphaerae]SDK54582.1 hypothetical protein SAMN05192566_1602 [Methylophilus rhizosphaerae]
MHVETETQLNQAVPNHDTAVDTFHSAEADARLLVGIFVHHFKLLTGESLLTSKLSAIWYEKQRSPQDLVQGLAYAKMQEWLTPLGEAFRLTEAGYTAAC